MARAPTPLPRPRAALAAPARGGALALLLAPLLGACVEITTSTEVRTIPHPDRARAAQRTRVVERTDFALEWTQAGADLDVEIEARPRCRDVIDVPVLRETRTIRRADPALYAEYVIVALCGGVAAYAFARPESFSSPLLTADGQVIRDPGPGYTAAGVFTGIAAFTLISAIRDSVRARDSVDYEDAAERRDLGAAPCDPANNAPWAERDLELVFGSTHLAARSDPQGRAHFTLPVDSTHDTLPPGTLLKAALRLDPDHALSVDIVVPYESTRGRPYRGDVTSAPAAPQSDARGPRAAAPSSSYPGLVEAPLPPPEPDPSRPRRHLEARDVP